MPCCEKYNNKMIPTVISNNDIVNKNQVTLSYTRL